MRKQTKLVAVLSAAALLALGASMTSFAATGWVEENGTWVYYDNDGYKVTDTWKKSVNNWFWLNSDGEMAVSTIVEDEDNYYYVDENGAMVSNTWVQIENEDADGEDEPAYVWYYFQANGKAYKAGTSGTSFKTINGKKYAFDSEGQMLYGWVDGESNRVTGDDAWSQAGEYYYCGDENDGAQRTGWAQIHVIDETEDEEDQDYWFYFGSNGKKVYADNGEREEKTINGHKYVFDNRGKMLSKWVDELGTSSVVADPMATVADYRYYTENVGNMKKGWFQVVPDKGVNKNAYDDEEVKWFYAKNDGTLYNSCIKTINGKKYAFNKDGEMINGLAAILMDDQDDTKIKEVVVIDEEKELKEFASFDAAATKANYDVYYFGDKNDGSMKLGNQNVEVDGETYSFFFTKTGSKKGMGFGSNNNNTDGTYIYDKSGIYVHGRKAKADSDLKYEAFSAMGVRMDTEDAKTQGGYLLNTSGSIMKNKKNVKDGNDMYICTDKDGKVAYYGEDKCGSKEQQASSNKCANHDAQ